MGLFARIKPITRRALLFLLALSIANLAAILVYEQFVEKPRPFQFPGARNLVVFAAHQDDGVIMASGTIQLNSSGRNTIVYLTRPKEPAIASTRRSDAERAWSLLGNLKVDLVFLDFLSDNSSWTPEKQGRAINEISRILVDLRPNLIIIPLDEGGQREHDTLNLIVKAAVQRLSLDTEVWQAAEYNPYYFASNHPRKLLWLLVRLAPFVPYNDPNFGLEPSRQHVLEMSAAQLEKKIAMLKSFSTERNVITVSQFGYPDLFDASSERPKPFLTVGAKRFDAWSTATIIIISAALFLLGLHWGLIVRSKYALLSAAATIMPAVYYILVFPKGIIEDALYTSLVSAGLFSGWMIQAGSGTTDGTIAPA